MIYDSVKKWIYRNARPLEFSLWQFLFENGPQGAVIDILMQYQNEDGGFGHALEADSWNPASTPITTNYAIKILSRIGFDETSHPIHQGIQKYLSSEKDLLEYGWPFTIQSNDDFPHAPWWNYSEEQNEKEYYGVTAELTAYVLKFFSPETTIYQKALRFADTMVKLTGENRIYGDMGLEGLISLVETLHWLGNNNYDYDFLYKKLAEKVTQAIEHDTEKWKYYGVRPSQYVKTPNSKFYPQNEEIVKKELEYLIDTFPKDDVWGITWTWFENMEQYEKYFSISENWWKASNAIDKILFLKNFSYLQVG